MRKKGVSNRIFLLTLIIILLLSALFVGYVGGKKVEKMNAECTIGFSIFCWEWQKAYSEEELGNLILKEP